jgi:hypothetical protein
VSEVLPGKHGWVLRTLEGCEHRLAESHGGKPHALVKSRSTVMESGRLRKGTARLRQVMCLPAGRHTDRYMAAFSLLPSIPACNVGSCVVLCRELSEGPWAWVLCSIALHVCYLGRHAHIKQAPLQ